MLANPDPFFIPTTADQLIMVVDTFPINNGMGTTLHLLRNGRVLANPDPLFTPTTADQLTMVVDASPINNGMGTTLHVLRNGRVLATVKNSAVNPLFHQ